MTLSRKTKPRPGNQIQTNSVFSTDHPREVKKDLMLIGETGIGIQGKTFSSRKKRNVSKELTIRPIFHQVVVKENGPGFIVFCFSWIKPNGPLMGSLRLTWKRGMTRWFLTSQTCFHILVLFFLFFGRSGITRKFDRRTGG